MTLPRIFRIGCAVALLLSAFAARADIAQTPPHPILRQFAGEGGTLHSLGRAYGVEGWAIVNPKGAAQYAYVTPEGGLLLGMLFAPDGTMETMRQVRAYQKKTSGSQAALPEEEAEKISKAELFYARTEKASFVTLGDAKAPYIYAYMNVTCDHCKQFWRDIAPAIESGKVQLRFIPYGALPTNRDAGAALLSVDHPEEIWKLYVNGQTEVLSRDKIKNDSYMKIDMNTTLAKNWKVGEPPFIIYRRPADGTVAAVAGAPRNILILLSELIK